MAVTPYCGVHYSCTAVLATVVKPYYRITYYSTFPVIHEAFPDVI